jgi:hypothetical protein
LARAIDNDRRTYGDAVKEATGLDAKEYAAAYAWMWERYEDAKVDAAFAARDLYVTPAKLRAAVGEQLKRPLTVAVEYEALWRDCYVASYGPKGVPIVVANGADVVLAAFVLDGVRRRTVPIRQFEEVYPLAQFALRGIRP